MTVTLSRVQNDAASALNTAAGTFAGSLITLNASTAGYVYLESFTPGNAAPGQIVTATVTLSVPAGAQGGLYELALDPYSDTGIIAWYTSQSTITAGETKTLTVTATMPAGTTSMRGRIGLSSTSAVAGRKVSVDTNVIFTVTATADEILAAPLSRPLRRTADDVLDSADYRIVAGTPGRLRGTITYLCSTLAAALAVDTIYQGTPAVTLSDAGNPLDGLKHIAVGDLRYGTERPVPGVPARWTLTAEIREVA